MPLLHLHLHHIAVFETLNLSLPSTPAPSTPLFAITGEAGAGKSLLLDALDWLFGAPLSPKDVLRQGTSTGKVELTYHVPPPTLAAIAPLLAEEGVEQEGELLHLSRELTLSGSRCRINGTTVARPVLEALRPHLLELQSQHGAVALFKPSTQRDTLDALGGQSLGLLKASIAEQFTQWQALREALATHERDRQQRQQQEALWLAQYEELEALALSGDPEEDAQLAAQLQRLASAEALGGHYAKALHALLNDETSESNPSLGVLAQLGKVKRSLSVAAGVDERLAAPLERLDELQNELEQWCTTLEGLAETVEVDPQTLQALQERLSLLERAKRLYGPTLADVLARHATLKQQLAAAQAQANTTALREELATLQTSLSPLLRQLREQRQQLASTLEANVTPWLHHMGMPAAVFTIALEPCEPTAQGAEQVQFLFSANLGEPPKPLAKAASGGELSRLVLALTVAGLEATPTKGNGGQPSTPASQLATQLAPKLYVFDEIDTGTSGQAARSMGKALQRLAQAGHQVLVVTHQAVVAAAASHHLHVSKALDATQQRHVSQALWLTGPHQRAQILSQLSGALATASEAPEAAIAFAEELLTSMQG
jgi:DNA repair protein RecN (Recombination protein N)